MEKYNIIENLKIIKEQLSKVIEHMELEDNEESKVIIVTNLFTLIDLLSATEISIYNYFKGRDDA